MKLKSQSVIQGAFVIMLGTVISRVFGFAKEAVIAYVFGATAQTDAFLVALIIPGILSSLVAGAITVAFIPIFTEYRTRKSEEEAWAVASTIINVVLLLLVFSSVVAALAAPILVPLVGPGLAEETKDLAISLGRVLSPLVILQGVIGLSIAIHNSYKHFTVPAFSALFHSFGVIIGTLLLTERLGVHSLAVGTLVGMFTYFIVQAIPLMRHKQYYSLSFDYKHPGIKRVALLVIPFLVGSAADQVNLMVDRILASGLAEGSISALSYSSRVVGLPLGIFAGAISVAIYPYLSQYAAEDKLNNLRESFSEGLRMLWLLIIPVSVGLIVLNRPIVMLLFERGAFDGVATWMTSVALMYYSIGLFASAGNIMLMRVFFSMQDTLTPVKLGLIVVVVNIALNLFLVRHLQHGGLALATSLASCFGFMLKIYYLRKKLKYLGALRIIISTGKMVVAAGIMGIVCYYVNSYLSELGQHLLLQVGVVIALGGAVYFALAFCFKIDEVARISAYAMKGINKRV